MNDRLTDDAYGALLLAREEARGPIGTEHLLLGLLRREGAFAARALISLGVTSERVREQMAEGVIEDSFAEEREDKKTRAERRLREDWRERPGGSPPSEGILEHALRQAEISGHHQVGTVHLLLGLLEGPEGAAVRALSNLGARPPDVRRRVLEMLRGGEYREEKRDGLHGPDRRGRRGAAIRLEALGDHKLAQELAELLVLTGIAEIPEEHCALPRPSSSGEREEPPRVDAELAARIGRIVEDLGSHIETTRDDLLGLELARRKLLGLLERGGAGS